MPHYCGRGITPFGFFLGRILDFIEIGGSGFTSKIVCIEAAVTWLLYIQTICLPIPVGIEFLRNHVYHQLPSNGMYAGQVRVDFTVPLIRFFSQIETVCDPIQT